MERKKQRIISAVIGIVITVFLVIIAVRFVQGRASQASQPDSLNAERVDEDTCKVSAVTSTDEPLLLQYGTTTPTFFYRIEPSQISPRGDGKFLQEAQIDQVGPEQVTFTVENFEDVTSTCDAYSNSAGSNDTSAGETILPTAEPTEPPVEEEPVVTDAPDKAGLTSDQADAYFADNPNAFITDCVDEFKDQYVGLAQVCGAAYQKSQSE